MIAPQTLYEKLWNSHLVDPQMLIRGQDELLYIDRHLVNEVTSPQAFEGLRVASRKLWRSETVIATPDHNVPTDRDDSLIRDELARIQVKTLETNIEEHGALAWFPHRSPHQGIVHVVGPELGATHPGMTIVCGDSHTSTHGAFAALAFGIGTSEVEHVLATQTLVAQRSKTLLVTLEGKLPEGVYAKDVALAVIAELGSAGANGHVIEFDGSCVRSLSMESRMTLCNMAIEAGARAGLVGVDTITLEYLQGRQMAPQALHWEKAVAYWRTLVSDPGAIHDRKLRLDVSELQPMLTWGTTPQMSVRIDGVIPHPDAERDPVKRQSMERALRYMGLEAGAPIAGTPIDKVFIGSCTNSRIEDLRIAAAIVAGRRIANNIRLALVVPGSGAVKTQAEAEGLDKLFVAAGFQWRSPGCSMCLGMNEDRLSSGERCASTSNRNFEGRQGAGGRGHLLSPAMAAAAALNGFISDVRALQV